MNISRARLAWWITILFFTFVISLNAVQFLVLLRQPSSGSSSRDTMTLLTTDFQIRSLLALGQTVNLKKVKESLYAYWGTDLEGEARIRQIVMEREWQSATSPQLLRGIDFQFPSMTQSQRALIASTLCRLYGKTPLKPEEVTPLIDSLSLTGEGWWLDLAKAQAYERAKQPDNAALIRQQMNRRAFLQITLFGVLVFGGVLMLFVGTGLLIWAVVTQWLKSIPVKPFPDLPAYALDGSLSGLNAYFLGLLLLEILLMDIQWDSQGIFVQFGALVISLLFLYRWKTVANPPSDWLGLRHGSFMGGLLQGGLAYSAMVALALPLLICLGLLLLPHLPDQTNPLIEDAFTSSDPWFQWRVFVQAVVFAPLIEEIIFRGVLFQVLWQQTGRVWLSAAMSGFLFAIIHPQFLGGLIPVALLGTLCALLFAKTRSLVPCIILHAINNGIIVVFSILLR